MVDITYRLGGDRNGRGQNIDTPGVNWGPVQVRMIARDGDYMVWHIPGSTQWSGQGEQAYYATSFYVLRVRQEPAPDPDRGGTVWGRADQVRYVNASKKTGVSWREARQRAIDLMHERAHADKEAT
jgi:hypothetical protein